MMMNDEPAIDEVSRDLCCVHASHVETEGLSVTWGRYAPSTRIARHRHERASLCIALSGGYDEVLDGASRRVDPGTILIHPEGEAHANRHDPRPTHLLTIEFSAKALADACALSSAFRESWHRPVPMMLPRACRLAAALHDDSPTGRLALDDALWMMIGDLFEGQVTERGKPAWLRDVRDHLHVHFADGPALAGLAARAGVHPVHLARVFRRTYGTSIGAYVRQRRLACALDLIGRGETGLAEIGTTTGFADQSHMSRQIHAATGQTPGFWQRHLASLH